MYEQGIIAVKLTVSRQKTLLSGLAVSFLQKLLLASVVKFTRTE